MTGDRIPGMRGRVAEGRHDIGTAGRRRDEVRILPGHVSGRPYVLLMADVPSRVQGKILLKN
ncbi:hypothetical protein [Streptomyces sp. NPDC058773]|uniref:hypothetical protein n=1 Tax=Streptomyces sp. NPDC058773 TaxID=3346632 RepID=UPI0036CD7B7C